MEVRNSYSVHHAHSVLEQLAKFERQQKRQEMAETIFHAILLIVFGFALGTLAFSFAGACTL